MRRAAALASLAAAAFTVAAVLTLPAATPSVADALTLTVIQQDSTTRTIGWTPVEGAIGYRFTVDGSYSHTWNGRRSNVRISRSAQALRVEAVTVLRSGDWPSTAPAPTPTPPPMTTAPTTTAPTGKTATPSTLSSALSSLRSGETLILEGGVYAPFTVNVAGVTIVARNRWKAVVDGRYAATEGVRMGSSAANVVLDGLEITRITEPAPNSGGASGVDLYSGGAGSTLRNLHIHDVGNDKTSTSSNGQNGVFVEVDNVTVGPGNFIHDIGRLNNDNHDHGVYADGSRGLDGVRIIGNFFRDVRSGWCVQLYPGTINGIEIGGNTFVNGNPIRAESQIVVGRATFGGGDIHDNLFWVASGSAALYLDGVSGSGLRIRNNRYTHASLFNASPSSAIVAEGNTRVSVAKPADPS